MNNHAIILAGGENLRYAEGEVPKVLQPFAGKPLLYHSIDALKEIGLKNKDIDVLVRDSFGNDVQSYVARDYPKISVCNYEQLYRWKKFGPMSKALSLAFHIDELYSERSEYGSSNWRNDKILVLNADSIYPERSLEIALEVADCSFDAGEQKVGALLYALNTIVPKKYNLPVFDKAKSQCSVNLCKKFKPFFKVQGKVNGFNVQEGNKEVAICVFRAGDLYHVTGDCESHHVPAIDGISTLDSVLHEIYPETNGDCIQIEHIGYAIDGLTEELRKSGIKIKEYDWGEIDDFDKIDAVRNKLTAKFESRIKHGHLKSDIGTGLTWIYDYMLADDWSDKTVLGIESNMTYLNLNNIALRDKGNVFLELLKSTEKKGTVDDDEEWSFKNVFGNPWSTLNKPEQFKNVQLINRYDICIIGLANILPTPQAWMLEAINWGMPVDLNILLDDFCFDSEKDFESQFNYFCDNNFKDKAEILRTYLLNDRTKDLYEFLVNVRHVPTQSLNEWAKKPKIITKNQRRLNQFR